MEEKDKKSFIILINSDATILGTTVYNSVYKSKIPLIIVKDLYSRYVTSKNSYDDFTLLFEELYNFILVDENFYNQYNGTVLIPEKTVLYVRKTNDNKYVVEENIRQYFSHLFTILEPVVQYTMMDFQDTYLTLTYDDFDHSNDISIV
jgi:hypothetical protein